MDRSFKQRTTKEIETLTDTLDQMDLIDIYRTFHLKKAKYTFFLNTHGIFSKTDHMTGHKTNLNNSRKLKSYQATSQITMA